MNKQYIYPQNMRASATLWLWSLKDFAIIVVGALFSAMVLATTRILIPAVLTAAFAFLSIRSDETTILDFIKYAVRYFISTQQYYEWRLKGEQKKEKKNSVQEFIGIETFTKRGLKTKYGELVFFQISPTNISVLSNENIQTKIWHLMQVLSAYPNIEITCLDSCERFDDNKTFMVDRRNEESNPNVMDCLSKDIDYLDNIQIEMSTARQFMFSVRFKKEKDEQIFSQINKVEKAIAEQGFEVKRMKKEDIKRFLAIYFGASMQGELIPDTDGGDCIEEDIKKAVA